MNLTRDRLHTIGWGSALAACFALTLALTFRVNAEKSEVRLANRQIAQLQEERMFLETEFEARANQQALRSLNDVDFGYTAPTAEQYLESERQLAVLSKPTAPGAPAPIRVASGDGTGAEPAPFPAMVSPLTGMPIDASPRRHAARKAHAPRLALAHNHNPSDSE